jgi:hypothetical protein
MGTSTSEPAGKKTREDQPEDQDRVSLNPLDPIEALRALLAVDPDAQPAEDGGESTNEGEPTQRP